MASRPSARGSRSERCAETRSVREAGGRAPRFCSALLVLAFVFVAGLARAGEMHVPSATGLGHGRYAQMHMVVHKTVFRLDVVSVDLWFSTGTRDRLATLAEGHGYSELLAGRVTQAVLEADEAFVRLRFERDVDYERCLDELKGGLQSAYQAGLMQAAEYRSGVAWLSRVFSAVAQRGFRRRDQIVWRADPKSLDVALVSGEGKPLLSQVVQGDKPSRTLLAGYFVPGSSTRELLVRSLLAQ
jgi:hypothetical protein